jgi:hypothetical protein
MSESSVSRRRFLIGTAVALGSAPLLGRLASQPALAQDLPALPGDNPTAVALAYAEDASTVKHASFKPDSNCLNCQFYTGKADAGRGPCSLFPNFSVNAKGWCSAWAKKA